MNESLYPFVNHTTYDIKALSALNRLAEASVRKEKSRRTKSLCWLLGVVGLVGAIPTKTWWAACCCCTA